MVVIVDRGVLDQQLYDGWHSKGICDAPLRDQPPHFVCIELHPAGKDRLHTMGDLRQLVNSRAVGQRGNDDRGVLRSCAGHQVTKVVGHDKGHLAVGKHSRLGFPSRAGRKEEPRRIIAVHSGGRD